MFRSTLRFLGLTLLLALPPRGFAAESAMPAIAALKGAALDLLRAQPAPPSDALELYIGNTDESLLLRQLTVWIDDAPPLRYDYSDGEAFALHQGGLHRFPLPALAAGPHRLRADFAARYADAPPDYWRAAGSVERKLTLDGGPQLLELELVKGSYIGKPELQVHELKPADAGPVTTDRYAPGTAADPHLRAAAYLTASDRPIEAALALLRLEAGAAMPPDFALRLGQALQAYGVDDRAQTAYQQALGSSDARLQSEARLGLAELQLGAGDLASAQQNAESIAPGLPKSLQMQAQDLQARIAMAQGDQAKALALVGQADSAPLIYSRYNLGVALLGSGQAAQGRALLEGIASGSGGDDETAALRDKVNVALGYEQLRLRIGANAVPRFSRVRSPSPYTGAALLGMGWAMLAPPGKGQAAEEQDDFAAQRAAHPQAPYARIPVLLQPALTDDVASWRRAQPFKLAAASPQEEQALRRALVPWVELIGRDPLDPAVQEGAIAIPYALLHIGADDEAQEYFQRAIRLLAAADTQLDAAQQRVRGGALAQAFQRSASANDGWPWWLALVPREHWWLADDPHQPLAAPDLFYLEHLMDEGRFRQAMQDDHDLWVLDGLLAAADGAGPLRTRIATAQTALGARLQQLALAELQHEQRQVRMYQGEARFALAHLNEPAAGALP
jgi:hypothetical protein